MNIKLTQQDIADLQDTFETAIAGAFDYVANILNAIEVEVPKNLNQRLKDATDNGKMAIREDGAFSFPQGGAGEKTEEEAEAEDEEEEEDYDDIDEAEAELEKETKKRK